MFELFVTVKLSEILKLTCPEFSSVSFLCAILFEFAVLWDFTGTDLCIVHVTA